MMFYMGSLDEIGIGLWFLSGRICLKVRKGNDIDQVRVSYSARECTNELKLNHAWALSPVVGVKLPSFWNSHPEGKQKAFSNRLALTQRSVMLRGFLKCESIFLKATLSTCTECQKKTIAQLSFAFLCLGPSLTCLKWCHLLQPVWASNVSYESRNSWWVLVTVRMSP